MNELIDWLTERMLQYEDDITDCCGDHELHYALQRLIDEYHIILDKAVTIE